MLDYELFLTRFPEIRGVACYWGHEVYKPYAPNVWNMSMLTATMFLEMDDDYVVRIVIGKGLPEGPFEQDSPRFYHGRGSLEDYMQVAPRSMLMSGVSDMLCELFEPVESDRWLLMRKQYGIKDRLKGEK